MSICSSAGESLHFNAETHADLPLREEYRMVRGFEPVICSDQVLKQSLITILDNSPYKTRFHRLQDQVPSVTKSLDAGLGQPINANRNNFLVATRPVGSNLTTIEEEQENVHESMRTQDIPLSQSLIASSQRRTKLNRHDIWTPIRSVSHHQAHNQ